MPGIKQEVVKILSGFVILLIFLFASLMYLNVNHGIRTDTKNTLTYQGALLEQSYSKAGTLPVLANSEILSVYAEIENVPLYIKGGFSWLDMENGAMSEKQLYDALGNSRYVYAMKYMIKEMNKSVYIISSYDDELEEKIRYESSIQEGNIRHILIGVTLIVITILSFVKILYWRLLNPVEELFSWVTTLDEDKTPSAKSLRYIELVNLVEELKSNIKKQKEFIDREEFFLRTVSHELRTPIAIISTSGELLERLALTGAAQRATDRIMYAVNNMKTLVQTLLWLSRKSDTSLPVTEIDVQAMIYKIVEDNKYLSQDKDIELNFDKLNSGPVIVGNYGTVHLVLINLIRNAIQYTNQGCITFENSSYTVTINNPTNEDVIENKIESSYGIGLYLVEKICKAQQYKFVITSENNNVEAKVTFDTMITD